MQWWCRICVVLVALVAVVVAQGEYETSNHTETGSMAQFDVPDTPKETTGQSGRDDSKDPSKWIMNLVSTKLPPSKRYKRPTTVPPKALAQGANDSHEQDASGLTVSPE